jgi:hypothetical protein
MEGYDREFWQFSDQLRLQNNFSNLSIADSIWSSATSPNNPLPGQSVNASSWKPAAASGPGLIGSGSKLAFGNATTTNADRYNYFPAGANAVAPDAKSNTNNSSGGLAFSKSVNSPAAGLGNDYYFSKNAGALNANTNAGGDVIKSYFNKSVGRAASNNNNNNNSNFGVGKKNAAAHDKKKSAGSGNGAGAGVDKRFKSLPASEALPRGEAIGGYIFVCNNDTMEENLKRQLFGLPSRYRDSVRAIRPGLPLFLYNYSTHQLHGIFEVHYFLLSDLAIGAYVHCFRIAEISSHAGCKLRRIQHRSNSLGGQEVPRRVPFPRSGEGRNEEDLRPAGGGRIPPHPPPLRRPQVQAGAQCP